MFVVETVCSDPGCAAEAAVLVAGLEEVEASLCDCDCGLVLVAVGAVELV
jgi:hypothetical protein